MKEIDLYGPVKRFLEGQGYEVKGEIKDCDVLAVRNSEEPLVVELKLSLNLDVLLQAVNRLSISPVVYIGIPSTCKAFKNRRRRVIKLLKMLGVGLLTVVVNSKTSRVNVVLDPCEYKPRVDAKRQIRLLGEFAKRRGDTMPGGSGRRAKMLTAYRQQAIEIAQYLKDNGPTKAAIIAKALAEPDARSILYRNVYGWFDRLGEGIYGLSPRGRTELHEWNTGTELE
ncbi:MAG TPA: DUF2161 family putative PD-(D/E)XK-type phosphodiesterase [Thermodesulfobacteriota bacterium]|nr:DUF2161 family putative PD-(D/E)XK-type phosphodiesterase [Thermodesulfobacteriota bacterium]